MGELIWSTYFGGSKVDYGWGITIDNAGNGWVVGYTASSDTISSNNAFQKYYGGGNYDCFVAKFSASGVTVRYRANRVWGLSPIVCPHCESKALSAAAKNCAPVCPHSERWWAANGPALRQIDSNWQRRLGHAPTW